MSLHFFAIPALDSAAESERLNAWMRGQRVVQVERHLVADGARSFWVDARAPKAPRLAALARQ